MVHGFETILRKTLWKWQADSNEEHKSHNTQTLSEFFCNINDALIRN